MNSVRRVWKASQKLMRPLDWVIVVVAFMIGGASPWFGDASPDVEHDEYLVTVRVNGIAQRAWRLPVGGERLDSIQGPIGLTVLRTDSAGVRVVSSPCPSHWCERAGRLHDVRGVIICAPNRLTVRIGEASERRGNDVDAITH